MSSLGIGSRIAVRHIRLTSSNWLIEALRRGFVGFALAQPTVCFKNKNHPPVEWQVSDFCSQLHSKSYVIFD